MNAVLFVGLVALLLVSAVMIAAIVATILDSTSRRRANELFWILDDLLSEESDHRNIDGDDRSRSARR